MSAEAQVEVVGDVATITLSADSPVISLTGKMVSAMNRALDEVEAASQVGCAVLVGTGSSFIVGADVKEMAAMSAERQLLYNQGLIDLANRLEAIAVPVIACLNGGTFGGGLEFALACSVRIAAERAVMGLPEVKLGIVPGSGGLVRLPRTVAPGVACEMIMTGRSISATEALRIGLVDQVAADGDELNQARILAETISSRGPLAVRLAKRTIRETSHLPVGAAIDEVQLRLPEVVQSNDAKEGFEAFIQKRPPRFTAA